MSYTHIQKFKIINKLSFLMIFLCFISLANSETAGNNPSPNVGTNSNSNINTSNNSNSSTTNSTANISTSSNTTNSSNAPNGFNAASLDSAMNSSGSANSASGGQGMGSLMNLAGSGVMTGMGIAFLMQEKPDIPMATFSFLQAAMGAAQALNQGGTSHGNKDASIQFRTDDWPKDPTSPSPELGFNSAVGTPADVKNPTSKNFKGFADSKNNQTIPPEVQKIVDKINSHGYKVDFKNGTFTTPEGNTISLKDGSNPSKVEAKLGFPAGTYAKGMEMVDDINKRNGFGNAVANLAETPGAGGANFTNVDNPDSYDGSGGKGSSNGGLNSTQGRSPSSTLVAGLTTKYNGENIGVAADDIFSMVSRRYNLKSLQDSFITSERPAKGFLDETSFASPKK